MSEPDRYVLAELIFLENIGLLAGGLSAFEERYLVTLTKGTFRRPGNFKPAQAALHFLTVTVFPKDAPALFKPCYPILDKHQERDFRRVVDAKLAELERARLLPLGCSRKSVTAAAGGPKFMDLLWALSNLALRQTAAAHPLRPAPPALQRAEHSVWAERQEDRQDFLKIQIEARYAQFVRDVAVGKAGLAKGAQYVQSLRRTLDEVAQDVKKLREKINRIEVLETPEDVDARAMAANKKIEQFVQGSRELRCSLQDALEEQTLGNDVFNAPAVLRNVENQDGEDREFDLVHLIRSATARLRESAKTRKPSSLGRDQLGKLDSVLRDGFEHQSVITEMTRTLQSKASHLLQECERSGADVSLHDSNWRTLDTLNGGRSGSLPLLLPSPGDTRVLGNSPSQRPDEPDDSRSSATADLPALINSLHAMVLESRPHGEEESDSWSVGDESERSPIEISPLVISQRKSSKKQRPRPGLSPNSEGSLSPSSSGADPLSATGFQTTASHRHVSIESKMALSETSGLSADAMKPEVASSKEHIELLAPHSRHSQATIFESPPSRHFDKSATPKLTNTRTGRTRKQLFQANSPILPKELFSSPPSPSHVKMLEPSALSHIRTRTGTVRSSRRDSLMSIFEEDDKSEGSLLFEDDGSPLGLHELPVIAESNESESLPAFQGKEDQDLMNRHITLAELKGTLRRARELSPKVKAPRTKHPRKPRGEASVGNVPDSPHLKFESREKRERDRNVSQLFREPPQDEMKKRDRVTERRRLLQKGLRELG